MRGIRPLRNALQNHALPVDQSAQIGASAAPGNTARKLRTPTLGSRRSRTARPSDNHRGGLRVGRRSRDPLRSGPDSFREPRCQIEPAWTPSDSMARLGVEYLTLGEAVVACVACRAGGSQLTLTIALRSIGFRSFGTVTSTNKSNVGIPHLPLRCPLTRENSSDVSRSCESIVGSAASSA